MVELILEPYAAHLHWQVPAPFAEHAWGRLLGEFLQALARRCEVDGQSVIGHIKGLATFPSGEYLRVNVISAAHPPDVGGTTPPGCTELTFTLNALVYGLLYNEVAGHVEQTATETGNRWGGTVEVTPVRGQDHASDHHH